MPANSPPRRPAPPPEQTHTLVAKTLGPARRNHISEPIDKPSLTLVSVAAVHRARVVVLGVDHCEDRLDVQGQLEVVVAGRLRVHRLRRERDDQARADVALQLLERGSHVRRVDAVLQVDVDSVESVLLDERVDAAGEGAGTRRVVDGNRAVLAANRQDDLLAAGLQGLDIVDELLLGVAAECRRQPGVD